MYEPFRAALLALREEFVRAVNRHPDVFFEELATPTRVDTLALALNMDSHELPDRMWAAFFKASETPENDDFCEWWITDQSSRRRPAHTECSRLFGDFEGIKEFKSLAESLALVLHEFDFTTCEQGDFMDCLSVMRNSAEHYPTPLLRLKNRTWGIPDESDFSQEALETIHQKLSLGEDNAPILKPNQHEEQCEDDGLDSSLPLPSDVAYPYCELLSPDGEALYPLHPSCRFLAHNVFVSAIAFIDAILDPDKVLLVDALFGARYTPPISLAEADERSAGARANESGAANAEQDVGEPDTAPAISPTEHRYVFRRDGDVWHMQFENECASFPHSKNFPVLAKLLANPGRQMDGLELCSQGVDPEREEKSSTGEQSGVADDAVDEETVVSVRRERSKFQEEIATAKAKGDSQKVAELEKKVAFCNEYLRRSTRDTDKREKRRSRPLGSPVPDEKARKKVGNNIPRGRKLIDEMMHRFAGHLEDAIKSVPRQAKWVYSPGEDICWEVSY